MSSATPPAAPASTSNLLNTTTATSRANRRSDPVGPSSSSNTKAEEKRIALLTSLVAPQITRKKFDQQQHIRRLAYLRKEAQKLGKTDWQFESVEKLLGR